MNAKGIVQLSSVDTSTTDSKASATDTEAQMQQIYPFEETIVTTLPLKNNYEYLSILSFHR